MNADELVAAGCGRRYTAAVLRIERRGSVVFERAYGTLDDTPAARATSVTTAFDLASLTKIFVATAFLRAVDHGVLTLDASLLPWLPEWRGTPRAAITARMLLAHTAGLASGADYRTLLGERIETAALLCDSVGLPGERVVYSDLGFIVLGVLLSRMHARALGTIVRETLCALGCAATAYRPRNDACDAIPATEYDAWRGRVRGAVHDEKAYLMNGIAGHAGLFGPARDVATVAEAYLAAVRSGASGCLSPALAREAIAQHGADAVLRRGLGWALKTSDENSCGAALAFSTFGHTGFTGTSVWADPACDLSIVLLTNAVYHGRNDLRDLRAAVCDAAVLEYGACVRSV